MIRPLAAGVGIGLSIFAAAFAAFYYGIWPISVILDQDPNHPV
ncbi:hypothetical protein [Mycolicibacterium porcinum]|uniref:DUF2613 domain-containing protein n=1 Tax=Mycolicibacterium porcinum TaxID=39693 RepID=A0ABV3VLH2_9MYCO